MATFRSVSPGPATAAPASATANDAKQWAAHGTVLTACVVGVNVLVILLIFFFFWRFFSGKPTQSSSAVGAAEDEDDDALPVASPWAMRRYRRPRPPKPELDVEKALPVYVYSAAGDGVRPAECAVCIVELKDGDSARRLPRCGHRFHADCVGEWLRLHATCPLCRAGVVAPPVPVPVPVPAAAALPVNPKDAAASGADCPV